MAEAGPATGGTSDQHRTDTAGRSGDQLPEDAAEGPAQQVAHLHLGAAHPPVGHRLAGISTMKVARPGRKLLFGVLVPPLPDQPARWAGDLRRFDRELRPDLVVETLRTMQAFGVEPDAWKIEGLDAAEDCARVAQAGAGGRDGGSCVVLGRDAEQAQVLEWLRTTAGVPGFDGFAVGRTLWEDALRQFPGRRGRSGRGCPQDRRPYLKVIDGFAAARRPRTQVGVEQP
jgi:Uncharacterized protein conserved in bacteria (DUF2090)